MSLRQAEAFIAAVPWRQVRQVIDPTTPVQKPPDPHQYVILGWREVPGRDFERFVALIRAEGYRGRYAPPYDPGRVMTNRYLQLGDWVYWFIHPNMLNRHRAEHRQHEVISDMR
jgi:hypothetical protein